MKTIFILPACAAGLALAAFAAPEITPGQWATTGSITSVEAEGLPPGIEDMIKSRPMDSNVCLTAEEAENAPENLFNQTDGQCSYDKFEMSGGQLDAVARCSGGGMPGEMVMQMTGTYGPSSYEMVSTIQMESPVGPMTIVAETQGSRTGDC